MINIIVNSIMKNENDFPLLRIFLNQTRRVCSASPGFTLCPCFGVLLYVHSFFRLPNFSRLVTLCSHPSTNKNTKKTKNRRPWLCWPAVVECLVSGLVNTFSYLPCGDPTNRKLLKDLRGADRGDGAKARPPARTEGHRVEHLMTLSDTQLSLRLLAQLLDEVLR